MERNLVVGDVFTSRRLVEAHYRYDGKEYESGRPRIDKEDLTLSGNHVVHVSWHETGTDGWSKQHKNDPIDLSADGCEERGEACFVVTRVRHWHDHGNGYLSFEMHATRLSDDGTWDPNGETVHFHQCQGYDDNIRPDEITHVKTMRMVFVD